jgi:ankyrin repeat protein
MWAAYNGHGDIIPLLLNRKANTNAIDKNGDTALSLAAQNGHIVIVEMLCAHVVNNCKELIMSMCMHKRVINKRGTSLWLPINRI